MATDGLLFFRIVSFLFSLSFWLGQDVLLQSPFSYATFSQGCLPLKITIFAESASHFQQIILLSLFAFFVNSEDNTTSSIGGKAWSAFNIVLRQNIKSGYLFKFVPPPFKKFGIRPQIDLLGYDEHCFMQSLKTVTQHGSICLVQNV